jgi:uncharacterized protein YciI
MFYMATNKFDVNANPENIKEVIPKHVQWVKTLIAEGKIVQAGKWGDSGGMAIFKAGSLMEAEAILNTDPLLELKLVTVELARFYPDVELG